MKKTSVLLFIAACCLILVPMSFAVELVDCGKAPAGYCSMKEVEGKKVVSFGGGAAMYSPGGYHEILSAYGLELADCDKAPAGYCSMKEVEGKKVVSFGTAPIAYSPASFDKILSAYK